MRKVKSIVLLVALIMIANLIVPTLTSIAAITGNYTVTFGENYMIQVDQEGTTKTVTTNFPSGEQNVGATQNIHLNNFDSEKMRAFLVSNDGSEIELTVDERNDTSLSTANVDELPQGGLFLYVSAKPGVILEGFNIKFIGETGNVWYSFDGNQETKVTENLLYAMPGNNLKIRGENRIIARLAIKVGNGDWQNLDKDAFKSENGVTINGINGATTIVEVEYKNDGQQQTGRPDDIQFDVEFTGTNYMAWVNNKQYMDDREGPVNKYNDTVTGAGYKDQTKTNVLKFQPSFGKKPVTKFIINNVEYTKNSREVQVKENDLWEITVPGAEKYTVRGIADENAVTAATIIWANPDYVPTDEANANWVKDFTLDHGYAKAIAVYDKNNNKLDPADYINPQVQPDGSKSDEYGLRNGFGWLQVMPGSKVVFEFVPEYGYQLTGITINEQPIEAGATMNRFEFVMPEGSGNVHFAATFTKTDDIAKTGTDKVTGGTISLGNNVLDGGSAQLTLNDVELSAEKIRGFEGAAEGYTVSNYLDIDLFQVFYKGKDDSDDVWANQIEELDEEVTITIQLADGVNGNDIVIVHNIHDGDEYEIIPTTYDPETHTITFKTKSFSNYAIASKTTDTISPKTGDNIGLYIVIFTIAGIGLVTTVSNIKKS